MKYIILLLIPILSPAQTRQSLFKKPVALIENQGRTLAIEKKAEVKKSKAASNTSGNLSAELMVNISSNSIEENPVILPLNKTNIKFRQIKAGDLLQATIEESAFAFMDSKTPIRVLITQGRLKGSILLGEANLEKNSKRITIDLKKFKSADSDELYSFQASVMDYKGILGLEGKIVSNEDKFFLAEVLAAGTAGYADATISRDQNAFGNSVETRNEDTFAKKALVTALSKTAERYADKIKQSPEFSILQGPIQIQVLVLDQPKLIND